jgi:nucleoside-diphosphate-sugar epimerase
MSQTGRSKILITGNLGYVGSALWEEAKKGAWEVFGIDKEAQSGPNVASFNLNDAEKTREAIKNFKPDVLIHAGSHSALIYKDNLYDPFLEDFGALKNVIDALKDFPDCRLIYYSSSYVYSGLPEESKVNEESLLKPEHNFGVAKSFFEQFILRNHPNSVVFRLSSVFGSGEAKHPNTILMFVKECLEKGQINVWGKGSRKLQYIYNKDVVGQTLKGLEAGSGIYNLAGDDYITVAEAANKIAEFFKAKVNFLTDKTEGETLPFLENGKLKTSSGIAFTPFAEALPEYLNNLKNNG